MTKVYDIVGILATDYDITELLEEGTTDYNLFFAATKEEAIDEAIRGGYCRENCHDIFIGVKENDNDTKALKE